MKDVKFKVWDINKKVFIPNDVYAIITSDFNAFGVMLKDWEDYKEGEYFYKKWQILIQYTGLKDKNGTEIYEGDIVRFTNLLGTTQTGFIKFRDGSFRISQQINPPNPWGGEIRMWNDGSHDWYSIENIESFEIEVIGNIQSNPELIKQ